MQPGIPADARQQREVLDREAVRCRRRRRDRVRRWQRRRERVEARCRGAPERRKHAIRIALARAHLPRFVQQRGVVAFAVEPCLAQRLLDERVLRDPCRVVQPVPEHRIRPRFAGHFPQHGEGFPAAQHEAPASRAKCGIQMRETVMQPPATGSSRSPLAILFGCVHVQRHDVTRAFAGGAQRRIVGEPQVAAEPDDRGASVGHGVIRKRAGRASKCSNARPRGRGLAAVRRPVRSWSRVSRRSPAARRCALRAAGES